MSFLFTDVERSTALWDHHPDLMRVALARHDALLRSAVESHGGVVFSTAGDAFSAAFSRAGDAVAAALDAQRTVHAEPWPDEVPVRVRMGVHTGEAHEREGDYFGPAVNRAARLTGLAHGGQVVASLAVEELLRDQPPEAVAFRGLGQHALRGLSRPETVFQVCAPGLRLDFPPLEGSTTPGNLPTPATSFVGRTAELASLASRLPAQRLLTLVGPGGVGKSRLAIETAALVRARYPDGVWFGALAPVADPDAVVHGVAAVLSVSPEPGTTLLDSIVSRLAPLRALIVLDNCEHVLDAAAALGAAIALGAPGTTVLATSRQPLAVDGEQVWDVPALDPGGEGTELFGARARSVLRHFDPAPDDRQMIGRICEHLDGMPLAIELAAGRLRTMSLAELERRLTDRFRVLRSPASRTADERHHTLRATVAWSYQLLSADEQTLFDRLSVFPARFDLDAAEIVCGTPPLDRPATFDLLASLVDKSLVVLDPRSGRYRLLETLRQYGAERLGARGEVGELRARHLAHYVAVAEEARRWYEGDRNADGRAVFAAEWDNLRAALDWAEAAGEGRAADALVRAPFWFACLGAHDEHERWAATRAPSSTDSEVLACTAFWADLTRDAEPSLSHAMAERALAAAPAPDHPFALHARFVLTACAWYGGRPTEARAHDVELKRVAAGAEPSLPVLFFRAFIHPLAAATPDAAPAVVDAARHAGAPLRNETLEAMLAFHAGVAAYATGAVERARAEWHRSAAVAERCGCPNIEAAALAMLAVRGAVLERDPENLLLDALQRLEALHLRSYALWAAAGVADWWVRCGRIEEAAHVIGFLDRHDPGGYQSVADLRDHATRMVDAHAGADEWRRRGAAMSRDEILRYCVERLGVEA